MMTTLQYYDKLEKDFKKKIGYRKIKKCCRTCMNCFGYEEEPLCQKMIEAGINRHVSAFGVCRLWTEKFGIPKEWGIE